MNVIRLSRSDITFLAVCTILGGVLTFVAQFIAITSSANHQIVQYGEKIYDRSVTIAADGTDVLKQLNASSNIVCSNADRAMMRTFAFRSQYLGDVGRIVDGNLLCTAMWGFLQPPRQLPRPSRIDTLNGTAFWKKTVSFLPIGIPIDVAANGQAAVFTEPAAFEQIEPHHDDFSALVVTHDGDYVFQSFGETEGLMARLGQSTDGFSPGHDRFYTRCSDAYDICLVARYSPPALSRGYVFQLGVFLFAGAVCGGVIGGSALWYRNHLLSWRQKLKHAIKANRLVVVYQPIVKLDSGMLTGAEALVRMIDDTGGWIYPDGFIAVAEEMGFGNMITRKVTAMALEAMQDALQARPDFYISINVIASDILDPDFLVFLQNETRLRGVAPKQVALELTERSTANHEALTCSMALFRDCGYRIFIDDFGTGYSSLSYISELPISGIKIDRMFIQALDRETVGSAIVGNIFDLASTLDVMLICEGVETEVQVNRLKTMRPDLSAQGWLFGKPVLAEVFQTRFLDNAGPVRAEA